MKIKKLVTPSLFLLALIVFAANTNRAVAAEGQRELADRF